MARGGARSGTPGKAYQNRSDLQAAKAPTGLPYGEHGQLIADQRSVPLPNVPAVGPAAAVPPPAQQQPVPTQQPFTRPTERPNEPVTAGLPNSPGPGPEALTVNTQPAPDLIGAQLNAIFQQFPNDDLLRVMALHQQGY